METKSSTKAKPMAQLLPSLSGILPRDVVHTLTANKQPPRTLATTRTTVLKPMTIAEMKAHIQALGIQSPKRRTQMPSSHKKKNWNSSVKIDRKINHTADGHLKNNPVRKALNFHPPTKVGNNSRMTMNKMNPEKPNFPNPEFQAKKALHNQAQNMVRISGVSNIHETPIITNKPNKIRMPVANKENVSNNVKKVYLAPSNVFKPPPLRKTTVPDTNLSNESWKSSCDASFLQNEKQINDNIEEKIKDISGRHKLNIAEITPPFSTPFKEYRNVQEFFNNSSELENSALYNDNTIMCFDKPSLCAEESIKEESVIVSLCDLLAKTKVTNSENSNTDLEDLLEVEKQTESSIQILKNILASQIKSLQYVRELINEKKNGKQHPENEHDKTQMKVDNVTPKSLSKKKSPEQNLKLLSVPCSVIKSPSKSPSYKIHKNNFCLRKKVFHKSMPNMQTPNKDRNDRALNMYMKMKEQMNFLNTPVVKPSTKIELPDTPAVTSHNLQRQLDKLYGES